MRVGRPSVDRFPTRGVEAISESVQKHAKSTLDGGKSRVQPAVSHGAESCSAVRGFRALKGCGRGCVLEAATCSVCSKQRPA
eukprot:3130672-Rhodomonas_salina.1